MSAYLSRSSSACFGLWLPLLASACDKPATDPCSIPDLPKDWACAEPVALLQTPSCDGSLPEEVPVVAATAVGEHVEVEVEGLVFRPSQEICAYLREFGEAQETLELLLQPCEMRPEGVVKGSCLFAFTVEIDDADPPPTLTVYRRDDFWGDAPPDPAMLLGTVAIE